MNITESREYQSQCKKLLAQLAIRKAEKLPIHEKIMIHHAIANLFDKDTQEHTEAKEAAYALATAEKKQLKLSQLLEI